MLVDSSELSSKFWEAVDVEEARQRRAGMTRNRIALRSSLFQASTNMMNEKLAIMEDKPTLPKPKDLSHHLSTLSRAREASSIKALYKYFVSLSNVVRTS